MTKLLATSLTSSLALIAIAGAPASAQTNADTDANLVADSEVALSEAEAPLAPLTPVAQQAKPDAMLPANTEVRLRMNQTVTTKGKTWNEGDTFGLTVTHNVFQNGYVIIPEGSRATGRIMWLTSKGAFGKSGKMDVELEYVEVNGRRINLDGNYRQEGEGNTVATIGGVLAAGIFAGFITGKSGTIPQGRELMAFTERAVPLALPEPGATSAPRGTQALPVAPSVPRQGFRPLSNSGAQASNGN